MGMEEKLTRSITDTDRAKIMRDIAAARNQKAVIIATAATPISDSNPVQSGSDGMDVDPESPFAEDNFDVMDMDLGFADPFQNPLIYEDGSSEGFSSNESSGAYFDNLV